jgi:hypothetical protein
MVTKEAIILIATTTSIIALLVSRALNTSIRVLSIIQSLTALAATAALTITSRALILRRAQTVQTISTITTTTATALTPSIPLGITVARTLVLKAPTRSIEEVAIITTRNHWIRV